MEPNNDRFQAFRRELAAQGILFRRTPGRLIGELLIFVTASVLGIALYLSSDHFLVATLAMWIITLAGMGIGTSAHTASHNAVSGRPWINTALAYFGYPFFLQVSLAYWRHKHLRVHHAEPNVAGVDDDADLTPFFALSEADADNAGPLLRRLYRFQWLYFPVLLVGNSFNMILTGWRFLSGKLMDPQARCAADWVDLGMLGLHYLVWVLLPLLFLPVREVLMFTLLRFALMSYAMFAVFAPAHFPAEAVMLKKGAVSHDWVAAQIATTVNFRTGWLGRLICGGLQYQIEHHLFPSTSPTVYPQLSKLVREYCEQHGYPYRCFSWSAALWKSFTALRHPKPVHEQLEQAYQQLAEARSDRTVLHPTRT